MALSPGARLGPYEILGPLGAGGMGEVYRARDPRLKREVALKVLPEEFTQHPEKLARFEREARLLAALNHPHIAAILGLEEQGGSPVLVLELVEGEDLARRLGRGAIPVKEVLEIGVQMAEALEAAHEKGVVHRDLKPANVKLTPDGQVKVLDFGLAKVWAGDGAANELSSDLSQSPTVPQSGTATGVVLGTAAYMSPEQASGKSVDKKADIWSLGVVLFEMLSGRRLFRGENASEVLAAVIKEEPDWDSLPAGTPRTLRALLRRCLTKHPRQRLHDIADARIELREALAEAESPESTEPRLGEDRKPPLWWGMAGLTIGGLAAGLAVWAIRGPEDTAVSRFTIVTDVSFPSGAGPLLSLSPDGSTVVYSALRDGVRQLFRRSRDHFETSPLPGTEGARMPAISPDGQWVVFTTAGSLRKSPVAGGPIVTLCECGSGRATSWGAMDHVVFADTSNTLSSVSASGGTPQPVTSLQDDEVIHRGVSFLPGGRSILFSVLFGERETAQIAVQSLDTGERRLLLAGTHPLYVPTGHLVFARSNALWAAPFDVDQLRVTGEPHPVVDGVRQEPGGAAQFAIADDGTLVYLPPAPDSTDVHSLYWADRGGGLTPLTTERRGYQSLALSPNGREVAVEIRGDDGRLNVWVLDAQRGTLTPLTRGNALNYDPVWGPKGRRIAFSRGGNEIVIGEGEDEERLLQQGGLSVPTAWSGDGELLAFDRRRPGTQVDIWVYSTTDGRAAPFLETPALETGAVFSPDGRWLAYQSNESGRFEVYVRPYAGGGRATQISVDGGVRPRWAPSGAELFFVQGDTDELVSASINAAGSLQVGRLTPVAQLPGLIDYDVHPDGDRFVVNLQGPGSSGNGRINVVLNWFEELKAKEAAN